MHFFLIYNNTERCCSRYGMMVMCSGYQAGRLSSRWSLAVISCWLHAVVSAWLRLWRSSQVLWQCRL